MKLAAPTSTLTDESDRLRAARCSNNVVLEELKVIVNSNGDSSTILKKSSEFLAKQRTVYQIVWWREH